ncbi:MAG: hypothetical protein WCJ03_12290 [Bacteroidales bacterium]
MKKQDCIDIGRKNVKWKRILHRDLTSNELNALERDLVSFEAEADYIFLLCLFHKNDKVKKLLYELGFTIPPFENSILALIIEFYNVETLNRFIDEGYSLTDIKLKRMIKRFDDAGLEIRKDFIDYFEKFKRDKMLGQKIKRLRASIKDKTSTTDA